MEKFKRVEQSGSFGNDFNDNLTEPGKYEIPMFQWNDNTEKVEVVFVPVIVTDVIKGRFHVIVGYDNNGKRMMWYYNGSQQVFKKVDMEDLYDTDYDEFDVYEFLFEDAEVSREIAKEMSKKFMTM